MNIRRILRQLRSAEGSEIAEAAVVLPLVFTFLLGIVWFGRAFNIYSTITQAAQQGAIVAARSSCATCAGGPSLDATVVATISGVMQASNIDPAQIPVNSNPPVPTPCVPPNPPGACTTTSNITICRNAQVNPNPGNTQTPQCGAIVSFQY